jgi:two-component system response regulator RegA
MSRLRAGGGARLERPLTMLGDTSERIRSEHDPKPLLLVEDDAPLRRNLVRALEKAGFLVSAVGTLREAHEEAADRPPEFAVLDLNLSDGHGMELVHTLLELRPGARVVILTGYDSIASSLVALKAGAVDYLAKPASADQIVAALLGSEPSRLGDSTEIPMSADRVRWEHIQRVFEQCGRNVSETARRLEMHRRTLQRILSKRAPKS